MVGRIIYSKIYRLIDRYTEGRIIYSKIYRLIDRYTDKTDI